MPEVSSNHSLAFIGTLNVDKESKMAALEEAFIRVASLCKILELNVHQKRAIQAIVVDKKDVFVNLLTGF